LLRHARERLDAEMAGRWNVSDAAARRRGLALRVRSDRTGPALELSQGSSGGRTGGEVWWTMSGADGRRLRSQAGFRPDGASWRAELGMELAGCAQTCRWGPTASLRSASARGSEPVDGGGVRRRRKPAPAHRHCIGQGLSICLAARAAGELPRGRSESRLGLVGRGSGAEMRMPANSDPAARPVHAKGESSNLRTSIAPGALRSGSATRHSLPGPTCANFAFRREGAEIGCMAGRFPMHSALGQACSTPDLALDSRVNRSCQGGGDEGTG